MKTLTRLFTARPTLQKSMIILGLGLMMLPLNIEANDMDEDIKLESWMSTPFENEFVEFEIQMENWMSTPFENEFVEFEIQMENWMTTNWL